MDKLVFGPAGIPLSTKKRSSQNGIRRCKELGLGAMELEFVRGVKMGESTAQDVNAAREETERILTAHAPYYINLNSDDEQKLANSRKHIMKTAEIGSICGAYSITFHPAYYQKNSKEEVYKTVKKQVEIIVEELKGKDIDLWIRPETMGKPSQFGDIDEAIKLSQEIDQVLPCIDFAHIHARSNGKWNTYEEFCNILEKVESGLGKTALKEMHCHVSGIEYNSNGEKNHLVMEESDFNYEELMKALKEYNCKGVIICESPNLEDDTLLLQKTYRS